MGPTRVRQIGEAGLDAVDAAILVQRMIAVGADHLTLGGLDVPWASTDRLIVHGVGKAAARMAVGVEAAIADTRWGSKLSGRVLVPESCWESLDHVDVRCCRPRGVNEPTELVVAESRALLDSLRETTDRDVCLLLVSGGASALFEVPLDGVPLGSLVEVSRVLHAAGTPIAVLNQIRGHLSRTKRGGWARAAAPARRLSWILSDVPGNDLAMVGSGPAVLTAPDPDGVSAALRRHWPEGRPLPPSVENALRRRAESPVSGGRGNPEGVQLRLIGAPELAVAGATQAALAAGFAAEAWPIIDSVPVGDVAARLAEFQRRAASRSPVCLVWGGEPTVETSADPGCGGRVTHLVLDLLIRLAERPTPEQLTRSRFGLVAIATDGEDGSAPASGAWLDDSVVEAVRARGLLESAKVARDRFDSFPFLEQLGVTLPPHGARTNVGDLYLLAVESPRLGTPVKCR